MKPFFCSTIIPTIGRPTLARAVHSILDQDFHAAPFEVIVVNDSGRPLVYEPWQDMPQVRVVQTDRQERCVARNTGAALAQGAYLHFLDDDDWLLPGALAHFWQHTQTHPDDWIYGITTLVDRSGMPIIELQHSLAPNSFVQVMSGEWIPLQSSLLRTQAFWAAGAFNPEMTVSEDVDLGRRMALRGTFGVLAQVVACVGMGLEGSTTRFDLAPAQSRRAREQILAQTGVLARLRASATNSSWQGRIARIYLTSMLWNFNHHRPLTALKQGLWAGLSLLLAGPHLFSPSYWRAVFTAYRSDTFVEGFARRTAATPDATTSHPVVAEPTSAQK